MAAGKGNLERIKRCVRTVFFMLTMVASLLVQSLPILVAIGDILVPCVLIPSFTCVKCYSFREHLERYGFRSSLMDIPLVSLVRSFVITCVYSLCDSPGLSHGPYLGTATLCSFVSILVLSVKACVFNATSEAEASTSLARQKLHLKKSWGMPVLFLSSVVFALGHMVVAYRTSCRARRKLLFHRVDPEAVLSCKNVFSGYQKVPRSPTPSAGKTPKSDSETRRKPFGTARDEGELPIRVLAEIDSLFIACQGLTLHYKLSFPESHPSRSLASTTFLEDNLSCSSPPRISGRLKAERPPLTVPSKTHYQHLHRSFSNQFPSSSLYAPLLEGSATSSVYFSEEIPVLSLDDGSKGLNSTSSMGDLEENGKLGIVLVHGFGGGVFSWRHVMGVLARQVGCTVAAFDRPGWGLTSRPQRKDWEENQLPNPYKLDTQVDLLLSFCSEMGFSSVILVGHDDGGLLALKAAQRVRTSANSDYVEIKGVVLLSVSLSREVVPAFARILLRTSLGKKHLVRPLLRTEITQVVNRRAWYDCTKLTTDVLNLYKAPLCIEGWDEALHEICRLSFETVLSSQNAEVLLKSVEDLPVLVVAGAEDALAPLKSAQVMASKLVNSRLVAVSGCGHLPHEECPKALLAALLPFITRLLSLSRRPNLSLSTLLGIFDGVSLEPDPTSQEDYTIKKSGRAVDLMLQFGGGRLDLVDQIRPTKSTVDINQFVDFLYDDLPHVFDDQGIDVTMYDERLRFRDPLTKNDTLNEYLSYIALLKKVFRPQIQLHYVRQTGPCEITTRWTAKMKFVILPWEPWVFLTGTSIMGINPENQKFCSHVDLWDSIGNNDYFSVEGLLDIIKQLGVYKTPDLESPMYQILKRTANYEVRKYSTFVIAEAKGENLSGSTGFTQVFETESSKMSIQNVLPIEKDFSSLKDPKGEELSLRKFEDGFAIVSKFSGKPTEEIVCENEKRLRRAVLRDGLKPKEGFLLGRYNDPGRTWSFMMGNEVLIWLEEFTFD
ncbi:SOUL heme-binding protein [Macleaya cordata]|uniref:SOUL heme-binding protein n=1 Tax=Macleaya cordata TaxID=56857 RepID=A0A200PQQ5_MACCD|nr:SOUL heme-binding protein [Macleaya cordata]